MPQWHPMTFIQTPSSDLGPAGSGPPQPLSTSLRPPITRLKPQPRGPSVSRPVHFKCAFPARITLSPPLYLIIPSHPSYLNLKMTSSEGSMLGYYHLRNLAKIMKELLINSQNTLQYFNSQNTLAAVLTSIVTEL